MYYWGNFSGFVIEDLCAHILYTMKSRFSINTNSHVEKYAYKYVIYVYESGS